MVVWRKQTCPCSQFVRWESKGKSENLKIVHQSVLSKESSIQIRCFLIRQFFGFQVALFVCAHVGVMFDWEGNKQQLLQGHVSFTLVLVLGYCI